MRGSERGVALVDLIVGAAIMLVIIGMALSLVGSAGRSANASIPRDRQTAVHGRVFGELETVVSSSAAKLAYVDVARTAQAVLGSGPQGPGGAGGSKPSSEGGTAKGGPASKTSGTATRGGTAGPLPGLHVGQSVWSWSRMQLGENKIDGPVGVLPANSFEKQSGEALVVVRATSGLPSIRVHETFRAGAGELRLVVARGSGVGAALAALPAGSVACVTGKLDTEVSTCLVELVSQFALVSTPVPGDAEGEPLFDVYRASCRTASPWGLSGSAADGAALELGRATFLDGLWTYYVRGSELVRVEGNPFEADGERIALATSVTRGLTIERQWRDADDPGPTGLLGLSLETATGGDGEAPRPLVVRVAFENGPEAGARVTVTYGEKVITPGGGGPKLTA
jgi:hypothetical protein